MRFRALPLALLLFFIGNLGLAAFARPLDSLTSHEREPAQPMERSQLVIEFHSDHLSVQARHASWEAVLQELERHTGIKIRLKGPFPGTLTRAFEAMPLEQGLRRLFREANLVFFYAKEAQAGAPTGHLTEIWLLPKERHTVAGKQPSPPASEAPVLTTPATNPEPAVEWARVFETNPQAARDMALNTAGAEERLAAIEYLSHQADPSAVGVLLEVIHDPDPHMRQTALEGLLPLLHVDPQVQQGLAHALETAQDPEVRQLVMDALESPGEPSPEEPRPDTGSDRGERDRLLPLDSDTSTRKEDDIE